MDHNDADIRELHTLRDGLAALGVEANARRGHILDRLRGKVTEASSDFESIDELRVALQEVAQEAGRLQQAAAQLQKDCVQEIRQRDAWREGK